MPSSPTRSRQCTSWARIRRCPIRTRRMPAQHWPNLSIWWCRISSSPRPPGMRTWCCRPRRMRRKWGTFTNTNRQVQICRPVLDPPGEARQDWELGAGDRARGSASTGTTAHPQRRVRGDGADDAVAQQHYVGAAGARGCGNIPLRRARQTGKRDNFQPPVFRPKVGACEASFRPIMVPPDELPDESYPMVLYHRAACWSTGTPAR